MSYSKFFRNSGSDESSDDPGNQAGLCGALQGLLESIAEDNELKKPMLMLSSEVNGMKLQLNGMKLQLNGVKTEVEGVKSKLLDIETDLHVGLEHINERLNSLCGVNKEENELAMTVERNGLSYLYNKYNCPVLRSYRMKLKNGMELEYDLYIDGGVDQPHIIGECCIALCDEGKLKKFAIKRDLLVNIKKVDVVAYLLSWSAENYEELAKELKINLVVSSDKPIPSEAIGEINKVEYEDDFTITEEKGTTN